MNQCCYYAFEMRETVFRLKDKMINDNNIFPKLFSTKDLRNCWTKLHKMLIIKLFLNYVRRKKDIGKQVELYSFSLQSFLNRFYYCQKNFNHVFLTRQLKAVKFYHLMLLELHLESLFYQFSTFLPQP